MENVNKMVLLPQNAYSSLLQKQQFLPGQTTLARLSSLDENIKNVLSDDTLQDDVKILKYLDALARFKHEREVQKGPTIHHHPPPTDVNNTMETAPVDQRLRTDNLLATIPASSQTSARILHEHLLQHKNDIKWNHAGQLIIDNQIVPGSNIVDLFHHAAVKSSSRNNPPGWIQFSQLLRDTNTPLRAYGKQALAQFIPIVPQVQQHAGTSASAGTSRRSSSSSSSSNGAPRTRAHTLGNRQQLGNGLFKISNWKINK